MREEGVGRGGHSKETNQQSRSERAVRGRGRRHQNEEKEEQEQIFLVRQVPPVLEMLLKCFPTHGTHLSLRRKNGKSLEDTTPTLQTLSTHDSTQRKPSIARHAANTGGRIQLLADEANEGTAVNMHTNQRGVPTHVDVEALTTSSTLLANGFSTNQIAQVTCSSDSSAGSCGV